jgi:hypothetical protein
MNATRLNANPLSQDLSNARPVLSADEGGGLLSGLLRGLLSFRSAEARPTQQRAEPRLQSARPAPAGDDRREPYLFGQRGPSADAAD